MSIASRTTSPGFAILRLMRVQQWIKNGFVLVPLFFGNHMFDPARAVRAVAATLAFCLLSSAVYVLNDLCDLEHDRQHAKKRTRPLASGQVSKAVALCLIVAMLAGFAAVVAGARLPVRFLLVCGVYISINLAYSLGLKHVALLELFLVSSGYILRLVAGATVIDEQLTNWLLGCTGLVSLMLTVGKRRGDMTAGHDADRRRRSLGQYSVAYLDQLLTILAATTVVAYLMFCISDYAVQRFSNDVTWTAVLVVLGVFRYLQVVNVYGGGDAPTTLIIRDVPLLAIIALWCVSFYVIIYVRP
jgi:decaprenyl-phosphate phosphoribosyltransferase